jgi:hypothetical protein
VNSAVPNKTSRGTGVKSLCPRVIPCGERQSSRVRNRSLMRGLQNKRNRRHTIKKSACSAAPSTSGLQPCSSDRSDRTEAEAHNTKKASTCCCGSRNFFPQVLPNQVTAVVPGFGLRRLDDRRPACEGYGYSWNRQPQWLGTAALLLLAVAHTQARHRNSAGIGNGGLDSIKSHRPSPCS